jgi:hypothetical protein
MASKSKHFTCLLLREAKMRPLKHGAGQIHKMLPRQKNTKKKHH